jgi:hypothetical protein
VKVGSADELDGKLQQSVKWNSFFAAIEYK